MFVVRKWTSRKIIERRSSTIGFNSNRQWILRYRPTSSSRFLLFNMFDVFLLSLLWKSTSELRRPWSQATEIACHRWKVIFFLFPTEDLEFRFFEVEVETLLETFLFLVSNWRENVLFTFNDKSTDVDWSDRQFQGILMFTWTALKPNLQVKQKNVFSKWSVFCFFSSLLDRSVRSEF